MPDIIDQGCDLEEQQREISLKMRKPVLKPCGSCYYCGEPVASGLTFCHTPDNGCRDDYEHRAKAMARNGTGF